MERACGLMNAVVTQVEVDEEKYHHFCSILHDEGALSGLDKMLSKAHGTYNVCCVVFCYSQLLAVRNACVVSIHLSSLTCTGDVCTGKQ